MASNVHRLQELLHAGDQQVWSLVALALVLRGDMPKDRHDSASAVLGSLGLDLDAAAYQSIDRMAVAAQASAPILQACAVLNHDLSTWAEQSDEALLAQGEASAQGAAAFRQFGLPLLAGLSELLAKPGVRMLDVGTGVGALAVAYAKLFPELLVVGLDVLPRALDLAAETIRASDVAHRVELRQQDVSTLVERDTYALAWVPAPFIPQPALSAGVARITDALVPGGWMMLGHGKVGNNLAENALDRFKTVTYGGTPLNDEQAQTMLKRAGLTRVSTVPTPPGAPAITVGCNPDR